MCRNTTTKSSKNKKEDNINNKGELVWDSFKETCEAKSVPENMLAQSKTDVNLMYTNFAEMSGMTLDELWKVLAWMKMGYRKSRKTV